MAFTTGYLDDIQKVGAGEKMGQAHFIFTSNNFETGLKVGCFCKIVSGELQNLDSVATPTIAGIVLRNSASPVESGGTVSTTYYPQVEVVRQGLVTVTVKTGETPAMFGQVYTDNATGYATATNTDIETNAEFIEEVQSGVWLVYMKGGVLAPIEEWTADVYTTATLPAASGASGKIVYVSDGANGGLPCLARSNGTSWILLENASSIQPDVYTVATLPTAASYTYKIVAVSNGNAGSPTLAWSNGTNWVVLTTGATCAAA
jgi:hypothetical protein